MKLSVLKEVENLETRVSATPDSVKLLKKLGFEIFIEKGAGLKSGYHDNDYINSGALIVNRSECLKSIDICLVVQFPSIQDVLNLSDETIIIGILNPYKNKKFFKNLNEKKITSVCMELIPRISRAQSMDVLSSQANLAGYRSVIDASIEFKKAFPMMMTAAGRINPAKVMVLGTGVAGLQAIATAKRLGSVVLATDIRLAAKEQVESLGAKFVMVENEESKDAETEGGYAREMSEEYKNKQSKLIFDTIIKQDIVITTALVPGKPAPVLITEEMINNMNPGSVVVDLAVESGGNCSLTKPDKIVEHNGVKIIGYSNFPGRVPKDASALYAKNIFHFLCLIVDKKNKIININWEDEIIKSVVTTNNGNIFLDQFK